MEQNNELWTSVDGGYKIPYNASIPLKQLLSTNDTKLENDIFKELWDNLHHQGDIGLASYLAIPEIVNICLNKKSYDWNYIGICVLIEDCRQSKHNPKLPDDYSESYFGALFKLEKYLLFNIREIKDPTSLRLTLALVAMLSQQFSLGKAIENLDEDILQEFIQQF